MNGARQFRNAMATDIMGLPLSVDIIMNWQWNSESCILETQDKNDLTLLPYRCS